MLRENKNIESNESVFIPNSTATKVAKPSAEEMTEIQNKLIDWSEGLVNFFITNPDKQDEILQLFTQVENFEESHFKNFLVGISQILPMVKGQLTLPVEIPRMPELKEFVS